MGIDYPHVDRVVHFSLPSGLEAYWQEAGRAGRTGAEALAIAFWRRSEVARATYMAPEERERYWALWDAWAGGECRQRAVAARLQMVAERDCGSCDRCMQRNQNWPESLSEWKVLCEKFPWWLRESARPREWMREKILRAP
jgi:ATP-dependent DNA helicase RecQ